MDEDRQTRLDSTAVGIVTAAKDADRSENRLVLRRFATTYWAW